MKGKSFSRGEKIGPESPAPKGDAQRETERESAHTGRYDHKISIGVRKSTIQIPNNFISLGLAKRQGQATTIR
ncbi:hypothetical protein J0656_19585 [Muricauda ruestringensis]|uniref:Uncharacterized protein n=1 Tax=Flagellimonas aurea TaxID=2915619 RepID=A0ABS3GB29_9FLAO|nr:hypothetical protein [Allomuricauda aurea]MBO0356229.1 hypothetical protein [Allomuricauda aurea]